MTVPVQCQHVSRRFGYFERPTVEIAEVLLINLEEPCFVEKHPCEVADKMLKGNIAWGSNNKDCKAAEQGNKGPGGSRALEDGKLEPGKVMRIAGFVAAKWQRCNNLTELKLISFF